MTMDRLEKALEKARTQRATNGSAYNSGLRAVPVGGKIPPAAKVLPSALAAGQMQLAHHRILAHQANSQGADTFRILRTQILQIMNKSGFKTLAITSPNYGDGKTTTALNLGLSIALDLKQTVLLADVDLRKPNLHEFLGFKPTTGLSEYLLDDVPLASSLLRLPFDRVSMLPAGRALENSSEVLGSPKMAALAHELKTRYHDRMVIYDLPPALAQDDPIAFLPHVDAVLVVIRDGITRAHEVRKCLSNLAGTNVIGTVLNDSVRTGVIF